MSAPERVLRVGILGAGWVAGDRHAPVYRRLRRTHLVAVCDQRPDRARTFAQRHGIAVATDSLDELLACDLDLVSICTPPFAHRDQAIALLRAGCHVFLEKPMAMNLADAEAMAAAARVSNRLLCVSHNFLFSRAMRRIRRLLASDETGAIQFVIGMEVSSPDRRLPTWYGELPAGLFFDESPHLVYLIASLLGDIQVTSAVAVPNAPGAEQPVRSVHVVLSSAQAPATVTMTFAAPLSEWHLIIVCERRILMADLFRDIAIVLGPDRSHRAQDILWTSLALGTQQATGFLSSGVRFAAKRAFWGHEILIGELVDAILHGKTSPVPMEDALRVVRVTDAILDAIRS